jgi:succinoglycan biosynthesis transport protein ExoP
VLCQPTAPAARLPTTDYRLMNYNDDNRNALVSVPPPSTEMQRRSGAPVGYPAGYPVGTARYPALEVERNSLREYWRIIKRHKWVVLSTLIILVALVTLATIMTRPVFRATVKVEIGKETERVMAGPRIMEVETANVFNPLYMQTQVEILQSRDLARRIIQKLNLAGSEEFQSKAKTPLSENEREVQLVNKFQSRYDVAVGRMSRVVSISFDAYNPQLAADVANMAADQYINFSSENRMQGVESAKDFLKQKLQEAEAELRKSEQAYNQYLSSHQIISFDLDKGNITLDRASELNKQLVEVENERRQAEALYQRSREVSPDDLPQVLNDTMVQNIARELSKQEQDLANLSAKYQPSYPAVKQVQEQVNSLKTQLKEAKQNVVKNVETQYEVARRKEADLKVALTLSKGEAIQQNREAVEMNVIKQKLDIDRKIYEDLLQRSRQAGVESEFSPSNIRKIQTAEVPIAPVKPNKPLNIGLSVLIGLALGIGLAFFIEYLNNTINTAEDVERITHLPPLGAIPSLQSLNKRRALAYGYGARKSNALALSSNGGPSSHELVSSHDSLSSYAESYRALRTSLLLSSAEHAPRTMLITSSHPGEGKTTIVANTAISLAQTGARVVVLDGDMRRPRCHKILNTKNDVGLSTYLSRDIPLDEVLQRNTEIPNLHVIPAGPVPPNPSELLSSVKLRILLAQLQDQYDHIVIDSPPVIHVTDALIISTQVDGVAIVVKSGHTPREAVVRSKQALTDVNAKIFGIVLNHVDLDREGYYYNYKYSYYHQAEESSQ